MPSFEVRALKQFLDSDQKIDCDCSNYWVCTHSGPLELERAIRRFGGELSFYANQALLARHVRCSVCGHYGPPFRLGWKAERQPFTGSHGAGVNHAGGRCRRPPARP